MRRCSLVVGGFALVMMATALPATVLAETPPEVFEDGLKDAANQKSNVDNPGWHVQLDLGASVSLSGNTSVVGKPDGLAWTLGANIGVAGGYRLGHHDWLNKLGLQLQFSNAPPIDAFIKSADVLDFSSTYYYRALDWVGPFVRVSLGTQMLPGTDVQAGDVDYQLKELDGTVVSATADTFELTDPFQPLILKQAVGAFLRPYWESEAKVEFRVGFAAQEALADGQVTVTKTLTDGVIELERLASANQVGAELGFEVSGAFEDNKILYSAWAEALFPFYSDGPKAADKSFDELINVELGAKIAFKLVDWASLSYEFKAVRQPQLTDDWQISNNLLLTFGFSKRWVEYAPKKKEDAKK